jgi:hypothetical protein
MAARPALPYPYVPAYRADVFSLLLALCYMLDLVHKISRRDLFDFLSRSRSTPSLPLPSLGLSALGLALSLLASRGLARNALGSASPETPNKERRPARGICRPCPRRRCSVPSLRRSAPTQDAIETHKAATPGRIIGSGWAAAGSWRRLPGRLAACGLSLRLGGRPWGLRRLPTAPRHRARAFQ